jgi:hypothetical protein
MIDDPCECEYENGTWFPCPQCHLKHERWIKDGRKGQCQCTFCTEINRDRD